MNELERVIERKRREQDEKSLDSFLIFVLFLFLFLFVIIPIIAFGGYIKDKSERESKIEVIGSVK